MLRMPRVHLRIRGRICKQGCCRATWFFVDGLRTQALSGNTAGGCCAADWVDGGRASPGAAGVSETECVLRTCIAISAPRSAWSPGRDRSPRGSVCFVDLTSRGTRVRGAVPDGDRIGDYVASSHSYDTNTGNVTAFSGKDGFAIWRRSIAGYDLLTFPYFDFNKDGVVAAVIEDDDRNNGTGSIFMINGRDGSTIWRKFYNSSLEMDCWLYDDIDDDYAYDLVVGSDTVQMLSGATGDVIWDVDYAASVNRPPIASFIYTPANPSIQDTVIFDASTSYDPNGIIVSYMWDFGDENITTTTDPVITHYYDLEGDYNVALTVSDCEGAKHLASIRVTVAPLRGDANHDRAITSVDVVLALEMAARGKRNADANVNGNGQVTSLDALMVMQAAGGAIDL
ncbi:MAG: PKD domain-containing protein [Methanosarcinales archaeon]|nr:MAG: PKD domain-containing protein [Methanosarcinales archaeon]